MGKLFRIIGASIKESDLLKISKKIKDFATETNISTAIVPAVTKDSSGLIKIGNSSAVHLEKQLKLGNIGDAGKAIYQVDNIPPGVQTRLINEVKDLPSYHVGVTERGTDKLKSLMNNSSDYKKLSDPKYAGKLTSEMVSKDSRLGKLCKYMTNKKFYSLSAGGLVLGATIPYVIQEINKHRERLSGCFRYTILNGQPSACKVASCSCADGAISTQVVDKVSLCDQSSIPDSMKNITSCGGTSGIACVNCPTSEVENAGKGDLTNDTSLDEVSPNDRVYYKCQIASILDAIGDLTADKIDEVNEQVGSIKDSIGSFLSLLITVAKYIVVALAVIFAAITSIWLYRKVESKPDMDVIE